MSDLLADRYRRVAPLGEGAMGAVWLADDLVLGRRVAVKQLRVDAGADTAPVERMVREARAAARLHHPNAVSVHDLITVDGQPYLIMEYVEGETLEERLRRVGRLPATDACAIGAQVARALEAAHGQGVVHRDVKPANIMITPAGVAKLADFGIARHDGDTSLTAPGHTIGTLAFMAPEAIGDGAATAASDVWSLGATLFAAVEGHAPYVTDDATGPVLYRLMTAPAPPAEHAGPVAPLIAQLLDREPSHRPSAGEAGRRLAAAQSAPPPASRQPSGVPTTPHRQQAPPVPPTSVRPVPPGRTTQVPSSHLPPGRRRSRRRAILAAVAAVVVIAASGLAVHLASSSGSDDPNPQGQRSGASTSSSRSSSPSPSASPSASNTVSASPDALFANPGQVTAILGDARTDITALLSYDYRYLDEHDQQVSSLTTGGFHDSYLDLTRTAIDPLARQNEIVLSARTISVGMGPFDGRTATVLAFVDTTRTDSTKSTKSVGYASTLSLQQVGGRWLMSGLEQDGGVQTDAPGSAGLAAAASAARRAAVLLTSLSKANVTSNLAELRRRSTGAYRSGFDAATKDVRAAATGGESSTGAVQVYAVSSAAGSSADILVDVKQTGTKAGKAYAARRVRLEVTLTRVGGAWLVSGLQNVD